MKKILLISLLTLSYSATAEILTDLKRCSTIEDNALRLDCFDTVSTHYNKHKPASTTPPPVTNNLNIKANEAKQSNSDMISISKTDAFGKTSTELSELESIKSHIKGEFKGWIKDDVIILKNGQKWKVTSNNSGYVNLQDPEVEITKGFWGSFNMKVTGLNAQAKVKRID